MNARQQAGRQLLPFKASLMMICTHADDVDQEWYWKAGIKKDTQGNVVQNGRAVNSPGNIAQQGL